MLRYVAALLLIPLLDSLFLVFVATQIGAPLTILIVVLTALFGLLLVRAESRHTIRKIQRKLARGEIPTDELLDGGLLLVAGALTLTPGLVTDAIGILLVFPLTRIPIRAVVRDYVVMPYIDRKSGGFATGNVYIGGFPFDRDPDEGSGGVDGAGGDGAGGSGAGGSGAGGGPGAGPGAGAGVGFGTAGSESSDDEYDLGEDAYDIEFEDDRDAERGVE